MVLNSLLDTLYLVNFKFQENDVALCIAAYNSYLECVKFLAEHCADLNSETIVIIFLNIAW